MEWQTYKEIEECTDEEEYYAQCFYIGVNLKKGDYLVGTDIQIPNSVDYKSCIDASGMAIFEPLGWATHVTTAAVGLGLGCLWEIDSIVGHVCALHGVENHISIKRLLIAILKRKSRDVGEAVEEVLNENHNKNEKD